MGDYNNDLDGSLNESGIIVYSLEQYERMCASLQVCMFIQEPYKGQCFNSMGKVIRVGAVKHSKRKTLLF